MLWLPLSIFAYLLNAIAGTVDKILLTNALPNPKVYTFSIGILNGVGIILIPFGFSILPVQFLGIAFLVGALYIAALLTFFIALQRNDASRVVTIVGSIQPVLIAFVASLLLGERLSSIEMIAFMLFICGGVLITYEKSNKKKKNNKKWLHWALLSGVLFAAVHSLTKYLFMNTDFVSAFVWTRIMTVLVALSFLLIPRFLTNFKAGIAKTNPKNKFLFVFGQTCGALFFVVLNYAISIGSVTLINGLQGVQYVFVLLFVFILSFFFPKLLKENTSILVIAQKVIATILIVFGIYLLHI